MSHLISVRVTWAWTIKLGFKLPSSVGALIAKYFGENVNKDRKHKPKNLKIKVGIVGDDCADKLGLYFTYVYGRLPTGFIVFFILQNLNQKLCKHHTHTHNAHNTHHISHKHSAQDRKQMNSQYHNVITSTKHVKLSQKSTVDISLNVLPSKNIHFLPVFCENIHAILFVFNLLEVKSLSQIKRWFNDCKKENQVNSQWLVVNCMYTMPPIFCFLVFFLLFFVFFCCLC